MTLEQIETLPKKEKTFWRRAINVDPNRGLTTALVRRSTILYGKNVLSVKNIKPLWLRIIEHFKEVVTILLTIAAIVSLILGIIAVIQHPANVVEWLALFLEFIVIVGIIFVDIFLTIRQSDKTDKALQTLKSMSAPVAKVVRNGKIRLIPSSNVVPGDIVVLEAGERVPADGRLITSSALQVDESMLTGESEEVTKDHEFVSTNMMQVGDRKDWVFSGTTIVNGSGIVRIEHTGMRSQIGTIAALLDTKRPEPTPLQRQIKWLSQIIGVIAVSVCLVTFFLYLFAMTGYVNMDFSNWGQSLNVSIMLAVASIPETLLAVITIILSIAAQNLSKQNALVKQLSAIETLGALSVVCTDKTGTLTKNVMTVTRVWQSEYPLQLFKTTQEVDSKLNIFKYGTLCSDARVSIEGKRVRYLGDPTETAILKGLVKQGGDVDSLIAKYPRVADIPFDSERKMMSVIVESDNPDYKYMIITKGAPDRILRHLSPSSNIDVKHVNRINDELGSDALRVLAVSVRYVNELPNSITPRTIEKDLNLIGLLGIIDPPRPEAIVSVQELKQSGIRTVMITGDHRTTAEAIAREIKILRPNDKVIDGAQLAKISDEELAKTIEDYSVFARVSPSDKLRIVNAWKANGKIVSMNGDGVNDAPSLKAASVGCAMGSGTEVAKDVSAMVLVDDNFSTIVKSIGTGRRVMLNIKSALTMLLTANLANFLAILVGILVFFISPIQSLQILFINIAVETILSYVIASSVRTEDVMSFKPRNPKAHIIDKRMLFEIILFGTLIAGMSLFAFYIGFANNGDYAQNINRIWHDVQLYNSGALDGYIAGTSYVGQYNVTGYQMFVTHYNTASLMSFLTIGLCLSVNGLYAITGKSLFTQKFTQTRKMLLFVMISILLIGAVSFIPGLNNLFNMGIYNDPKFVKYFNYDYILMMPFIAVIIFIIVSEIYRSIFGLMFNIDGSRRTKGKILDVNLEDDLAQKDVASDSKKNRIPAYTHVATSEEISKVSKPIAKSSKQISAKKPTSKKPKVETNEQPQKLESEKQKKLSVSRSKYGSAGEHINELIVKTSTKIKTVERKKEKNKE